MKKEIKIALIILGIVIFVFFVFAFFYPVAGKITEGNLFLTISCAIKPFHYVELTHAVYICNHENDWHLKVLNEWKGYRGCNESTKGYYGNGQISNIHVCRIVVIS